MQQREVPIFFDQSGKRWRITESVIVILVATAGVLAQWLIPSTLAQRRPPDSVFSVSEPSLAHSVEVSKQTQSADQLMQALATKNTAVIGSGPFVRVVGVEKTREGTYVIEPFSGKALDKLNEQETSFIDGDDYAIQRYGTIEDRRMYLTFDDGPDDAFTPQLLDLLSRESAPATFFVSGNNVARFPEIAKRLTKEGHSIGNHTFSHIDFDPVGSFRGEQEINLTQRLIAATTDLETTLFRPPYVGNTDQSLRNGLKAILTAQQLGYSVASYDFDSNDWSFTSGLEPTFPSLEGAGTVILLHDGGGDRTQTITYVEELIRQAKEKGYTFATLNDSYPNNTSTGVTTADHVALMSTQLALVWPRQIVNWLFVFTVSSLVVISLFNVILAVRYSKTKKHKTLSRLYRPSVTVVLPAYNEEKVLSKSIRSLIRTRYRFIEIVIVDDGSTDGTWDTAQALANRYKRVAAIHQENGGKPSALNNAIAQSKSDIIICVDADTLLPARTIINLIRHFEDETIGAVAGVVKVGNPNGILTKWQALEYISGISIERNAQALLGAIMIVPGACGAWRRSALMEVGGFSSSTLAEDCDLALKIQKTRRYKILQDNQAISYTEAPQSILALTKQRFRWTFGNIQSLWKHRNMVLNERYGWLGLYVMPSAILAIIVPILFWPLLVGLTVMNITSGNYRAVMLFFLASLVIQLIVSVIGIALAKEKYSYILAMPFARVAYGPIRMYILYKTILTILKGVDVGWNKLTRTGTVHDPLTTNLAVATARPGKA